MNVSDFTRTAATMVARNDRRAPWRALRRYLANAGLRVGVAWSALVIAAFVLYLLPLNMRLA